MNFALRLKKAKNKTQTFFVRRFSEVFPLRKSLFSRRLRLVFKLTATRWRFNTSSTLGLTHKPMKLLI